ncbi:cell division protein FtsK, partial [Methylobacterium radiotolerans]
MRNQGGRLGAYLADILLYLFGFSAWWWVVLLLHRVRAGYRRLAAQLRVANSKQPEVLPRVHWEEGIGFFLLMMGSLGTWSASDPGWSHSVPGDVVRNQGGRLGAYLADIL